MLLHAAIAGALIISTIQFQHSRQVWGSANTAAGSAVAINSVKTIPLPSRAGKINPVANDTESQVPQESKPKPEPKKQVEVPEKAIPLPSRIVQEAAPARSFEDLSPGDRYRKTNFSAT